MKVCISTFDKTVKLGMRVFIRYIIMCNYHDLNRPQKIVTTQERTS